MTSHICTEQPCPVQELTHEWYGREILPHVEYSFSIQGENLVYCARQEKGVSIHPGAQPGAFTEELWRYDTAEFFISNAEGTRYLEFNLCPNGAWWACVFTGPRCKDETAPQLTAAATQGRSTPQGWECRAEIPLAYLASIGITPQDCRLAAAAIQNSPDYLYLTTAEDLSGEPDFHRPWAWPKARII